MKKYIFQHCNTKQLKAIIARSEYKAMTQELYTEALNFLVNYFNQFDEDELNTHSKLYVNDIVDILGYATFEDNVDSQIGYISDVRILSKLRDEVIEQFYN